MPTYALLITPRAEAAFFADVLRIAQAELSLVTGLESELWQMGDLRFLRVEAQTPEPFARLSCVQGAFEWQDGLLRPLALDAGFHLHSDFVWGEKYRGKTNETLTQLLINLALGGRNPQGLRLLDPMCGRGTSLLWALRYGMEAVGVDRDASSLPEMRRALKKWSKVHRQKHKLSEGWVQKTNRSGIGKHLDFEAGPRLRAILGETGDLRDLVHRKRFDLIVTDAPYGVQHQGSKDKRSPEETLLGAVAGWAESLNGGGRLAMAFNSYMPKRAVLEDACQDAGLVVMPTDLEHRMSESILRDVLLVERG